LHPGLSATTQSPVTTVADPAPRLAPDVSLRTANIADAPAITWLFHRVFTEVFGHTYPPHDLASFLAGCDETAFAAEIADTDHAFRLAEKDGTLIGFVKLGPSALPIDTGGRHALELRQLYLLPEARGTGVAQALMDWALAEARGRGAQDLYLTVWIDNHRARRFYERYGFREVGSYAFMVGETVDDDRILKLTL
jgi:ribosomal protein S18 acetylase RimI-like enzyme